MRVEKRDSGELFVSGYINAVDRESRVLHTDTGKQFVEIVKPKTFERALQNNNPIELRFNHEKYIGSTSEGNLILKEDNIGLYAEAVITDPEVISRAEDFTGWSFTFIPLRQEWSGETNAAGIEKRYLEEIDLLEVSVLDKTPAYIGTSITHIEYRESDCVKICKEVREFEDKAENIVACADNIPPAKTEDTDTEAESETETPEIIVDVKVDKSEKDNKIYYLLKDMEIVIEKNKI